jgi:hypothetical protein
MGAAGCGGGTTLTCKDAVNHMYEGYKCQLTDNDGQPMTLQYALEIWCRNEEATASEFGCTVEFDTLLECLASIKTGCDNNKCGPHFDSYDKCTGQ